VAALLVAVSRIYLVVHYPSDVLVGLIVGVISGSLGALIASKLPEVCYETDLLRMNKGKHEKA
ncbi:MAG: phosphatase PAP2 family protein, partial [Eubacteriales bacterium]|nr:phosphatase PAP2 family protein [Eubacteriales bacterium]